MSKNSDLKSVKIIETQEYRIDEDFVHGLVREYWDLVILLHQDNSTEELEKTTKRFIGVPVVESLPYISKIESMLSDDIEEFNQIIIRVVKNDAK